MTIELSLTRRVILVLIGLLMVIIATKYTEMEVFGLEVDFFTLHNKLHV